MRGRVALLGILAAALLGSPCPVAAEETPGLTMDGLEIKLTDGVTRVSGGELTITRGDLVGAMGVDVRRLIPRATPERKNRRAQRPTWVLAYGERTFAFRLPTGGAAGSETFSLRHVCKGFGWKLDEKEGRIALSDQSPRSPAYSGKVGGRLPDLRLPCLVGEPESLRSLRGKRVLLILWAPWSQSRDTLATWATEWRKRREQGLEIRFVAVDVEGKARVRPYVPPGLADRVLLDRDGRLPGILRRTSIGSFTLIDDIGLVRATGTAPTTVDLAWIDAHLKAPVREPASDELDDRTRYGAPSAKRAYEKSPKNADRALAHARFLERSNPRAAQKILTTAFTDRKARRSPELALTLARMHFDAGDRPAAMRVLDEARRAGGKRLWLRRQFWALDEPDRFYTGAIDTAWQRETQKAEDKAWGLLKPKRTKKDKGKK